MKRLLLHQLFKQVKGCGFCVTYWDGNTCRYGEGEPRFTIAFHDEAIVDALRANAEMGFCEGYMNGSIDVEGDLADVAALAARNRSVNPFGQAGPAGALMKLISHNGKRSLKRQQADVAHHYDLGNDFFRLWLDESMTYSCAYFRDPTESLETAQLRKIDHVLRKVRLKPGESLLDIGSGWGALILRAAQRYGARVLGITLSEQQLDASCNAIHAIGLQNADVKRVNYLELANTGIRFDKIVSIGMIEHVGKAHLPEFVDAVQKLLKPGGLALLHHITCANNPDPGPPDGSSWAEKYIFPGSYIPALREMIDLYAHSTLRVQDVENLRPHYALTLDCWSERFEKCADQVAEMYGGQFVRMWRLYLRTASAGFREGVHDLHQTLCSNGVPSDLPLTRDDLYQSGSA